MREIRQSGSEGGVTPHRRHPYPIHAAWGEQVLEVGRLALRAVRRDGRRDQGSGGG